jgi:hypothetical protein
VTVFRDWLRPVFAGRRIVLAGAPVAAWTPTVRTLRELGASAVLVVGTEGTGTGELPSDDEAEWVALDAHGDTIIDVIRAGNALLADLPAAARQAIDRFDPDGDALVVGTFLHEAPEVAGRRCLAWRRPAWLALEDKTTVDALWDRAGVARTASEVVEVSPAALMSAARLLDDGAGTVWAGDAREGFNGGGEYVRWLRDLDDVDAVDESVSFFAARCGCVRVMPFLDGIPCSVHGVVVGGDVLAFRPIEMVVLRRCSPPRHRLHYAGCATWWDPPPDDRDAMRDVVRRVGAVLRDEVGFLGPFTVDGVLTAGGFRPTELNPRSGAGTRALVGGLPDLPLQLVYDAVVGGVPVDWEPALLERTVVEAADGHRFGATWCTTPATVADERAVPLVHEDGRWRRAADGEPANGRFDTGPSPVGGFVRLTFDDERPPATVGDPVGSLAAAFYAFCDAELGTSFGPMEAARPVR